MEIFNRSVAFKCHNIIAGFTWVTKYRLKCSACVWVWKLQPLI